MIPLPDNISSDDVEQWFNQGVVLVRTEAGVSTRHVPCWYAGIRTDPDDDGGFVRKIRVAEFDGNEHYDVLLPDVFGHWPRCGAINVPEKFALHVQRRQQRQYRRTYNERAVAMSVPDNRTVQRVVGEGAYFQGTRYHRYTRSVFDPVYYSAEEAMLMLTSGGWGSVALSPTTIITYGDGENRRVYYNNELVAKVSPIVGLVPLRGRLPRAVTKRLGG